MNLFIYQYSLVFCLVEFVILVIGENVLTTSNSDSLVLVHILSRHGNRTPGPLGVDYPNNPYRKPELYAPFGYMQLSNKGKQTSYNAGIRLRQRYDKFLGKTFHPDQVEARSTNRDRTRMSLQLLLAGLFPPNEPMKWSNDLNWQPVPYYTLEQDMELRGSSCPAYKKLYSDFLTLPSTKQILTKYKNLFHYLTRYTGKVIRTTDDVFNFCVDLTAQMDYGYPQPEWSKPVFPGKVQKVTLDNYYLENNTTSLKQYGSGFLLQKIIKDTRDKIAEILQPSERKLFIYMAHEYNIASVLISLGIFDDEIPAYASYILFEVHKIDGEYGFKIYYQSKETKQLLIPTCGEFCKFEDFVRLTSKLMPPSHFRCDSAEHSLSNIHQNSSANHNLIFSIHSLIVILISVFLVN